MNDAAGRAPGRGIKDEVLDFRIDDKAADSVALFKTMDIHGNHRYHLAFKQDHATIMEIKDLNSDELDIAVGEKNAGAIQQALMAGKLSSIKLRPDYGLSPQEHARHIADKESSKGTDIDKVIDVTLSITEDRLFEANNPNSIRRTNPPKNQGNQIANEDLMPEHLRKPVSPVPVSIADKYIQEGRPFYVRHSDDKTPAFTDRGDQLSTSRGDSQVAQAMVEFAFAHGWNQVELRGSEDFRRAAWVAAEDRGLQSRGYDPTPKDIEAAAHRRSIIEVRETSDIAAGRLPEDLRERAKDDPEALKAVGIHQLARAVSKQLLQDRVLRERFEKVIEQRLVERMQAGQPLPQIMMRKGRDQERHDNPLREPELSR